MVAQSECSVKSNLFNGKKVSKPLMEKKRRARINRCLDQLKTLLENYYTNNIRKRKLEKADILELTVKHLRNLQKIQHGPPVNAKCSEYQAGYRSCLTGVNQYLLMADNSSASTCLNLLSHTTGNIVAAGEATKVSSTSDSDTAAASPGNVALPPRQTTELSQAFSTLCDPQRAQTSPRSCVNMRSVPISAERVKGDDGIHDQQRAEDIQRERALRRKGRILSEGS
ncbi:hypothetical protein COCON_G00140340 [Conger conger]|uniref:Uncharacterized protein n=1 Tax=Conger conger TaxID=82655 RepID=A0A9Q1HVI8_CONCO|nr:hypothetical protein COCON_G00140340 [Conger conger]